LEASFFRIREPAQLSPWLDRSAWLERRFESQALEPGRKTLAIFGAGHCELRGGGFAATLAARHPGRVAAVIPVEGGLGASEAKGLLGLGSAPRLVPSTGTPRATIPAGAMLFEGHALAGASLGQVADALVWWGDAPDRLDQPDETELEPEWAAEVERRDRLWAEARAHAPSGGTPSCSRAVCPP
jgi:pimeloyl-ACP methyl ester carboxylesterase